MNKKIAAILIALLTAVSMTACGTTSVPGPERVITKTVEVPGPERVITKTVEVPGPATNTTPAECLTALDLADQGFLITSEVTSAAADGFVAVSKLDVDGLTAATDRISAAGTKLTDLAPQYNAAKAACRATAS